MQIEEKYIVIHGKKLWIKWLSNDSFSEKPTLILLHNALGSVAQWKDYPLLLADRLKLNVLLYDRIGNGRSDEEDDISDFGFFEREAFEVLPELIAQLNIKKTIIYGHSDGGTIALMFASKFRTEALIVEAAHVMIEETTQSGVIATIEKAEEIVDGLKKYHGDKANALFSNWSKLWSDPRNSNWNIKNLLGKIDVPCLIIQGKQDEYATSDHPKIIAEGISGQAEIYLIDECRHSPHKEQEQALLERIASFLQKTIKR